MAVRVTKDTVRERDAREFAAAMFRTTRKSGIVLQSFVVPITPFRTGRLRRSIRNETRAKGRTSFTATVGTNVEYAPFVELKKSYLRLGLDIAKPTILKLFDDDIAAYLVKD